MRNELRVDVAREELNLAADHIVVRTGPDQTERLKPSDIESRRQSRTSLMAEGLLNHLSLQQIADLLEFLSTLR